MTTTTTAAAAPSPPLTNPHFADKETLLLSRIGPVEHHGVPCAPNETIIQVARYGRIYKRKNNAQHPRNFYSRAPEGTRFCRFCKGFLPLCAFYTHIRRYVCKRHHAERKYATETIRITADIVTDVLVAMLDELQNSADILGYPYGTFSEQDIRSLMIHTGIPFSMSVRIMPIDPSIPMRPRNVAIVGTQTCKLIMKCYSHMCSPALYIASVQRCNLIPRNMDPLWPQNPLHDPDYRRVDIDTGPLLLAELQGGDATLDCVDRTRMETLIEAEPPAPWIQYAETHVPLTIAMRSRIEHHLKGAPLLRPPRVRPPKKNAVEEVPVDEDDD
jgi:hypothetical protein